MTAEELRSHFILHGVKCVIKRNEVLVQTCVFCGNTRWNLEANPAAGVYHCWTCNAGGRVDALIKEITGVTVHVPITLEQRERQRTNPILPYEMLMGTPAADSSYCIDYCRERRLSVVDMAIYQLRAGTTESPYENRVVFPLLEYWSRHLSGFVGRSTTGAYPKWYGTWLEKKCVTGYRTRSDIHVVVEGAMDGVRVHKAGFNAAVLIGTSNPGIEEWAARVPPAHYVVVMLDGDASLEANRLYWVIYPIHEKVKVFHLIEPFDPESLEETTLATAINTIIDKENLDVG